MEVEAEVPWWRVQFLVELVTLSHASALCGCRTIIRLKCLRLELRQVSRTFSLEVIVLEVTNIAAVGSPDRL